MVDIPHNKKHAANSSDDHTSTITEGNIINADANGLIADAGVASSNVKKHNFAASAPPDETNDVTEGYSVGSNWWVAALKKLFICFGITEDSAVWKLVSSNCLVSNKTGGQLDQLFVVKPSTPQGNFPTVELAQADTEANAEAAAGILLTDITDNGKGYVINNQAVYDVDGSGATFSESWSVGDELFLSAGTSGHLTKTEPASPLPSLKVACVISNHATQGILAINLEKRRFQDSNIGIQVIGTPTNTTQRQLNCAIVAAGLLEKTADTITDAGGGNINIAARQALIRSTDSDTGDCYSVAVPASNGNAIPTDTKRWIGVEYNSGSPQFVIKTTDSWDNHTDFPIGLVTNDNGTLHILNNPVIYVDHVAHAMHRLYETEPFEYAARLGGGALGETGTRNVTLTACEFYDRFNEFPISNKDTSASDTFASYYGTTQQAAAATQWDNQNFNLSGTLTALTTGRYANLWFYVEMDDSLVMVYGDAQYTSAALAQIEKPPSTIPLRLDGHARVWGRIGFLKGASTASYTEDGSTVDFVGAAAAGHNDLSGLQGGTAGEYNHLNNDELANAIEKTIIIQALDPIITLSAGDGVARFVVPEAVHGMDLVDAKAHVFTASTSGLPSVQIHNITQAADMLSTNITIDENEKDSSTATTPLVIDTANDDVATGDEIRIDVDVAGTGSKGLEVRLKFLAP